MAGATEREYEDPAFVRLSAAVSTRATPEVITAILDRGPPGWVSGVGHPPRRRYTVDLRLRLGGETAGLVVFRKAALIDLGSIHRTGLGASVQIEWQAATAAPLFPVFAGELSILPGELSLTGLYAPPGGLAGRLADRALLHVAATGTARWLLVELDRLGVEAAA